MAVVRDTHPIKITIHARELLSQSCAGPMSTVVEVLAEWKSADLPVFIEHDGRRSLLRSCKVCMRKAARP